MEPSLNLAFRPACGKEHALQGTRKDPDLWRACQGRLTYRQQVYYVDRQLLPPSWQDIHIGQPLAQVWTTLGWWTRLFHNNTCSVRGSHCFSPYSYPELY